MGGSWLTGNIGARVVQGLGAALLDAVVRPDGTASLWVADPNPRAQAFYRKHRFDFDGAGRVEAGVRELRMARTAP